MVLFQSYTFNKSFFKQVRAVFQDLSKYIPECLLSSILFCDNFLKLRVISLRLLCKTVADQKLIRQEFVYVSNKKHKAMHTLLQCIYYDRARKNIGLEGWCSYIIYMFCNFNEISLQHGCSPVNLLYIFRTTFPKNSGGMLLYMVRVPVCVMCVSMLI